MANNFVDNYDLIRSRLNRKFKRFGKKDPKNV